LESTSLQKTPSTPSVIYIDDDVLVVNKPSGLRTIADGYDPTLPFVKKLLQSKYGRLWVVHRLDKDTSGVLVLARNAAAHKILNQQFEQRVVGKTYHAIVVGTPHWERKCIDLPLRVNGDRRHRTVVDLENGKSAITEVKVLERFSGFCLMLVSPHSGYTHQIRSHLSAIGFPIAADPLYYKIGVKNIPSKKINTHAIPKEWLPRLCLHASEISFIHPLTKIQCVITAEMPEQITQLLAYLKENKQWS